MPRKNYGTHYFPNYTDCVVKYCSIFNELSFRSSDRTLALDGIKDREIAQIALSRYKIAEDRPELIAQILDYLYE